MLYHEYNNLLIHCNNTNLNKVLLLNLSNYILGHYIIKCSAFNLTSRKRKIIILISQWNRKFIKR
jgi:hypothetical protein